MTSDRGNGDTGLFANRGCCCVRAAHVCVGVGGAARLRFVGERSGNFCKAVSEDVDVAEGNLACFPRAGDVAGIIMNLCERIEGVRIRRV